MDKKLIASLILAFCGPVLAAGVESDKPVDAIGKQATLDSFANLDTDGNGALSTDEISKVARPSQDFDQSDANHDSRLDRAEYQAYLNAVHNPGGSASQAAGNAVAGSSAIATFEQLDSNGDGKLTQSEYDTNARVQASGVDSGPAQVLVVPVPPGTDAVIMTPPSAGSALPASP